jgi:hypothetical protein
VATTNDDQKGSPAGSPGACGQCGSPVGEDQRYCLKCGARQGRLPQAIAAQLTSLLQRSRGEESLPKPAASAAAPAEGGPAKGPDRSEEKPERPGSHLPSPRAAAFAVLGMLGLGVLLGSATDQFAQSAGFPTILLESSQAPEEEAAPEASGEPETEEVAEGSGGGVAEPPIPRVEPPSTEPPVPGGPAPKPPTLPEPPPGLPEVKHVFVIMLGENGFEETFGEASQSKFLGEELPAQGELLPNYFAVTKGELANQVALLSGQGPTPETAAECPNYADVSPGTESAEGQVEGNGCVYPATTKTLPGQLTEAKLKWKAYVEGIENGAAAGQPASCRHPALGTPDPDQAARPGDAYLTWRNPFVYFHSILDSPECAKADVGLPQLATDLKLKAEKFPALAYVVPDACHKGGEAPCEPGQPSGPVATEAFLKTVVPEIKGSLAYKDGGMLVITSAEARQGGEKPDTSGCCNNPSYPNLPSLPAEAPATGPTRESGGGGRVGALLLSPFVEAGTTSETYFNHYSLLVTIEETFGLERLGYGSDPALTGFDESIFNAGS